MPRLWPSKMQPAPLDHLRRRTLTPCCPYIGHVRAVSQHTEASVEFAFRARSRFGLPGSTYRVLPDKIPYAHIPIEFVSSCQIQRSRQSTQSEIPPCQVWYPGTVGHERLIMRRMQAHASRFCGAQPLHLRQLCSADAIYVDGVQ